MAPFPVGSKAQGATDHGEFNVKRASQHLGSMQLSWYEASCPYETSTRAESNQSSKGEHEDTSSGDDKHNVDGSTEDEWLASHDDMSRQISTFSVPDTGFGRLVTGESWPTYSIPDETAIPATEIVHGHCGGLSPAHPCVTIPPRDDSLGVLEMWEPMQAIPPPPEAGMMWPVVMNDWYADGMWESGETVSGEHSPTRPPTCLNMWETGENAICEQAPAKQPMCTDSPKSPTQTTSSIKQDRNRRKSRSLISMAQKAQQKQNPRQQGRTPQQQVDQNSDQTQWQPEASWSKGNWSQMSEAAADGAMSGPAASPTNRGDAPQQSQTTFCTSCAGEILPHFKFCRFCGMAQSNLQYGAR